jgi:quinol monooxygenase YgiN
MASPVFSLLVTLQFQDADALRTFQAAFAPLAQYVRANEPDTLAYEALLSDKDPLQVLVLERYRNKEHAYLQVHKSSAPFLQFRPQLAKLQDEGKVTLSGHSYTDSQIGFGDRLPS